MTAARLGWHLNIDAAASVDSNINNGTDLDLENFDFGEGAIPVEVKPAIRRVVLGLHVGSSFRSERLRSPPTTGCWCVNCSAIKLSYFYQSRRGRCVAVLEQ
jgi:hypothetical protein